MRPARLGLPFIEAPGRRSGIKHLSLFSVVERVQEAGASQAVAIITMYSLRLFELAGRYWAKNAVFFMLNPQERSALCHSKNGFVRPVECRCPPGRRKAQAKSTAPGAAIARGSLNPGRTPSPALAEFLDSWQKVGPAEARKRAMRYLTAMPAWAHKAEE